MRVAFVVSMNLVLGLMVHRKKVQPLDSEGKRRVASRDVVVGGSDVDVGDVVNERRRWLSDNSDGSNFARSEPASSKKSRDAGEEAEIWGCGLISCKRRIA